MKRLLLIMSVLGIQMVHADEKVTLKDGAGRDLVAASCGMCHSLDYIPMNSVFLDGKGWEASVNKMIKVMGAPIKGENVPAIVDYLSRNYGIPAR